MNKQPILLSMKCCQLFYRGQNRLIEKNNDAYKGFKNASDNAESPKLKSYLMQQASERQAFANKLSGILNTFNPDFDLDTDGSATGSLHRTWMDVKTALSMDDDESILEECIRENKASVEEYQEFLEDYPSATEDVARTIREQSQNIKSTLERVKRLEDLH